MRNSIEFSDNSLKKDGLSTDLSPKSKVVIKKVKDSPKPTLKQKLSPPKVSIKASLSRAASKPRPVASFKAPGRFNMNTISINIGKDGTKTSSHFIGDASGRGGIKSNRIELTHQRNSKITEKVRGFQANK